jgi:four helix bundle protein
VLEIGRFEVWKEAHALTLQVYRLTAVLPGNERFGRRMQRAAVSIPAEGFKWRAQADKIHFNNIVS